MCNGPAFVGGKNGRAGMKAREPSRRKAGARARAPKGQGLAREK